MAKLDYLLFQRQQDTTLADAREGRSCPDCAERDRITDNGQKGAERTFQCEACWCQWDNELGR